jgi:replication factor C small subunit
MSEKAIPERRTTQFMWAEKYRPKTLDEFIGNEGVKLKMKGFIEQKDLPHLLFYGTAGGGKTALAKLLVKAIPCDHLYINASDERTIDTIRDKIVNFAATVSFEPLRIVILDEADYLPALSQAALRNVMETYALHSRFILTCNYIERMTTPIISRCGGGIRIQPPEMADAAALLSAILENEKVVYKLEDIEFLVKSYFPDIRQIINCAQQNVTKGKLAIAVDSVVETDYKEKLLTLLKTPKKQGVFGEMRQLVADASFSNYDEIYRYLFDKVSEYGKGKEAPLILELADSVYQSSLVFEKEITLVAALQRLLKVLA